MDWKEIEFVLESADQEADRPYADGWETIRFEIEDDEVGEPEAQASSFAVLAAQDDVGT